MPWRILSLDGGGIRGLFQSEFLVQAEQKGLFPLSPLYKNFDCIMGTSTGAIIGMAIALGVDPADISKLYREHGNAIFCKRWFSGLRGGPHYSADSLRNALREYFGEARLTDCKSNVYFTATVLNTYVGRAFSTLDYVGRTFPDKNLRAVDVVVASSAAPTIFPAAEMQEDAHDPRSYLDGGLWGNNPTLFGLTVAKACNVDLRDIRVFSIGTGIFPAKTPASRHNRSRPWSLSSITTLLDVMFAAQNDVSRECSTFLIGADNLMRVNPTLPEAIALDDVSKALEVLPGMAPQPVRDLLQTSSGKIRSMFESDALSHTNPEQILALIRPQ